MKCEDLIYIAAEAWNHKGTKLNWHSHIY